MTDAAVTNAPEWTVSELSGALRRTIESEFGFVRVRAEISNYRGPHPSGHAYFCLKDEGAKIDAVVWRSTFLRLRVKPAEGLQVVITGRVTTYPGKSAYQIIVDTLEPAGLGALMALLEERRRKLAAEGLFDAARKRAIPYLPRIVGVVTSPTGAVIRDILHRIADRFPRHVVVWPVRVQGEASAADVVAAIRGFNALGRDGAIARPDVMIVARGGGALEDLWSFNEEIVVRAAAESRIPLVSAVGHETDWTLIDHAADLRAPTPTGAAEMCVPVRSELTIQVAGLAHRHGAAIVQLIGRHRTELRGAVRALPSADALIAVPRQRLDRAAAHLVHGLRATLDGQRIRLGRLSGRLATQSPQAKMARAIARLDGLGHRLARAARVDHERRRERLATAGVRVAAAFAARANLARQKSAAARERLATLGSRLAAAGRTDLARRAARLTALEQLLGSLGYRSVLARGFALVRDALGAPVPVAAAVAPRARLDIEFADGFVRVTEGDGSSRSRRPRESAAEDEGGPRQGLLL